MTKPVERVVTVYEAANRAKVSTTLIRRFVQKKKVSARKAEVSSKKEIYLLDADSLSSFLKKPRKAGRPKKKSNSK